jgi:hypothetical protein
VTARRFTQASSNRIRTSPGGLVGINGSGITIVAVCRRDASTTLRQCIVRAYNSASAHCAGITFNESGNLAYIAGGSITASASANVPANSGWVMLAGSKTTGSANPRLHRYVYATDIHTHVNGDFALGDSANTMDSGGTVRIGENNSSEFLDGGMAVLAYFPTVLTDMQIEGLTDDVAAWFALSPTAMWIFDQDPVSALQDEIGSAHQTTITGTSVDSTSPPIITSSGATGTGAFPVPPVTMSASGTVSSTGSIAVNVPALTMSAAGTVSTDGSAALTLPSLGMSAAGTVSTDGSASISLPAVGMSASGTVATDGSAAFSLAPVDFDATGIEASPGSIDMTMPAVTMQATGIESPLGTIAMVLPAVGMEADGQTAVAATGAFLLPALTMAATGIETPESTPATVWIEGVEVSGVVSVWIAGVEQAAVAIEVHA